MPELLGLTKREAVNRLALGGIDFEISGSGVVISQEPKPFLPIAPGLKAQIILGPESKFIRRELAAVRDTEDNPLPQSTGTAAMLHDGGLAVVLKSGNEAVEVAAQPIGFGAGNPSQRTSPARPSATPVPDLDQYAQGSAVPGAGKQAWSQWLKEQARITRDADKASKGSRRQTLVNESEKESKDDDSDPTDPDFSEIVPEESADARDAAIGSAYDLARAR
jgi:hypothetical protein